MTAAEGHGGKIAADIVAADDIDYHVDPAPIGVLQAGLGEIGGGPADRRIGAHGAQFWKTAFIVVRDDDGCAGGMRHADRERADAAGRTVDQDGFAHGQAAQLEQVVPHGEQPLGQGGCLGIGKRAGHDEGLIDRRRTPRRIAAAGHQAHQPLAHQLAVHTGAAGDHFAADFQAEHVSDAGRGLGDTLTLHDVGPVDAGGEHAQQDFASTGLGHGALGQR
ncbi:hypothetical protein D9M72_394160 [compost metagenome]